MEDRNEMKIGKKYQVKTAMFRRRQFTGIYEGEYDAGYFFRLEHGQISIPKGDWVKMRVRQVD